MKPLIIPHVIVDFLSEYLELSYSEARVAEVQYERIVLLQTKYERKI